jgi:hypothetical protein
MRYCKIATGLAVCSQSRVFRVSAIFTAVNAGVVSRNYNPVIYDYLDRAYWDVFYVEG